MSTIDNSVSIYESLGLTGSSDTETKTEESSQDQFMQLLIAQLENQDPLEPQENGDFLSQLAQFETAAGIEELQESFESFTSIMQSSSVLQASNLVGRSVLAPGGNAELESGNNVEGSINLSASTTDLSIEITDSSGQLVKTISMGTQAAGEISFSWDGTDNSGNNLPAGSYQVQATADISGEETAQEVLVSAKVDSVTVGQDGQGIKLNLVGSGSVYLSEVEEIR